MAGLFASNLDASRYLLATEELVIKNKVSGARQLNSAIGLESLRGIAESADSYFKKIDQISRDHGPWNVGDYLPTEARYIPSARSISLPFVVDISVVLDAFSSSLRQYLIAALGVEPVCDLDLAWLRRQYPSSLRPAASTPHSWHQDGAYGFDFSQQDPQEEGALVPMLTLWAPLNSCGEWAPGLELIGNTERQLLALDELSDDVIAKSWPYDRRWRPVMSAGDVLLIKNHVIHRTHVNAGMSLSRSCVELRFFPKNSIPPRIAGHQFITMI